MSRHYLLSPDLKRGSRGKFPIEEDYTVVSNKLKRRVISIDFALQLPGGAKYCMINLYSEFEYTWHFNAK
jgi:hypothetical protein